MNNQKTYMINTIVNAVLSALISFFLVYYFLDLTIKYNIFVIFVFAFWIFFNLEKILLKEMELSKLLK